MKSHLATISLISLSAATASALSSYSTDFESFPLGANNTTAPGTNGLSAIGQADGWRGDGLTGLGSPGDYDAEIVDIGGTRGNVFRISNPASAITGNYDTTHPATPALTKIGETGSGGTPGTFSFSFDFRSVSSTKQDGMRVEVTPFESGTASRQSLIRIQDTNADGFSVGIFDTTAAGVFQFFDVGTNLDRTAWFTLQATMTFVNGPDNDAVAITLLDESANVVNSISVNTWEGFYANAGGSQPATAPVDSVIFRTASVADEQSQQNPNGFTGGPDDGGVYFDNLSTEAVPEPATVGLGLGLAALGLAFARRRRAARATA
jgi:MYXO-CTERM domain-containing protein